MKKTWTEVSAGALNAATQRFWVALGNNAEAVANQINTKPGFVDKLAKFAEEHCVSKSPSRARAREIMGKNFFGVEEAVKHFGINPKGKLAGLCDIPWSEKMLESVIDTHVLVAVFPLSILDIRLRIVDCFFGGQNWYDDQGFANFKGEVGWHLVRKIPVEGSMSLAWKDQQQELLSSEKTPSTRVLVYTIIGHFKSTGSRLFENARVRTSTAVSAGSGAFHVGVSDFGSDGLYIDNRYWDYDCFPNLGLASEMEPWA